MGAFFTKRAAAEGEDGNQASEVLLLRQQLKHAQLEAEIRLQAKDEVAALRDAAATAYERVKEELWEAKAQAAKYEAELQVASAGKSKAEEECSKLRAELDKGNSEIEWKRANRTLAKIHRKLQVH
uniref:Uncharacterized protein n=1 Tax=Chlamydomonas leiostraca TaxID=1034604 RepID=A0A7S0R565_9CHLO|mmetsp:Transcript_14257/g.35217  ORF Transcript_14257/g.35217 Transcript_14257/m.35217 type:complete len:126 (+) Transcript_14257:58-435(+)